MELKIVEITLPLYTEYRYTRAYINIVKLSYNG